jgi:hypothetical protein
MDKMDKLSEDMNILREASNKHQVEANGLREELEKLKVGGLSYGIAIYVTEQHTESQVDPRVCRDQNRMFCQSPGLGVQSIYNSSMSNRITSDNSSYSPSTAHQKT